MNTPTLLANATPLGRIGGGGGLGPFADFVSANQAITGFAKIVSSIIGIITIAAFIWFLLNVLVAGLRWLQSEGDKHKLEEAQNRLTNAFIGLIIVACGQLILALAAQFLGVPNILNPGELINQVRFGG